MTDKMKKIYGDTDTSSLTTERVDIAQNPEILEKILEFYNLNFPYSLHSKAFKENRYSDPERESVVYVSKDGDRVIGLVEAWSDAENPAQKVLATLVTDSQYRNRGLAKKLFTEANRTVEEEQDHTSWVLHFRDSKKDQLAPFYTGMGFENLSEDGHYRNGEVKYKMTRQIERKKEREK